MNFMFEWQEQYLTSERSERVVPYLCRICAVFWRAHRASQNTNNEYKFSAILHNKTSDKRFIIPHAKLVCSCERISWIFNYRECVIEVCEAERNWRGKSSLLIGQWQET